MGNFIENLHGSLYKGFIDQNFNQLASYTPKLLVNNKPKNENVLNGIVEELEKSTAFIFSVAFITESGLATLKSHFLDLKSRGIKGRILTSTFMNFNQPKVFKELMKIENIEVRVTDIEGFHAKGYIFDNDSYHTLIVGSSNLTAQALKVNYEWNIKLTSHENGEIIHHFKNQFEEVWGQANLLSKEWIEAYQAVYRPLDYPQANQVIELPEGYHMNAIRDALEIEPNKMQQVALREIQAVRDAGNKKSLIISATGTGKTYLAAFDVRKFAPKRMLFIVHREQILKKAMADFKKVLGGIEQNFGILSGTSRDVDVKYVFATVQTISKAQTLEQFDPTAFDYILIDEVHKAGAKSYLDVIDYFEPAFLMGMTATPERTDDFNIYGLFDYNIAYEIRLQEALEEDMLCPFHYFGVTDFEYNGMLIDEAAILRDLVTDERVDHIIEKIEYYGHSGETVKGLIFCSRKDEAKELSFYLNQRGLRTVSLTGDDTQDVRAIAVKNLENGMLDYILTVDIFNEGIDIPSINQVVMLRQTQSSIIFIQQLGRGLRKHNSKDYVTIIDFIGNYKNNYLIPIALSGDQSQNKDSIRRHTNETSYIKGVSTVNFEEVAKREIFKAINNSNLTGMKVLRDAFVALKNRIGRTPYLLDFMINHSIDPVVIANKEKNYYEFLLKIKEEVPAISAYENKVLTMLSGEILNGKRKHELILLDLLLQKETVHHDSYTDHLIEKKCRVDQATLNSVKSTFDLSFFTIVDKKKYGEVPIITLDRSGDYLFGASMQQSIVSNPYFKKLVIDILQTAKEKSYCYECENPLTLYEKYTRKDVCKLLNWDKDESATIFGYKPKHNTCPIFVTYHKNDEIEVSVDYGDEFISPEVFKWYTRSNRTLASTEVQKIIYAKENNFDVHLFIKKDDDEGRGFYYLGEMSPDKTSVEQDTMHDKSGKEIPVVHMNMVMEQAVDHSLYQYLIHGMEA